MLTVASSSCCSSSSSSGSLTGQLEPRVDTSPVPRGSIASEPRVATKPPRRKRANKPAKAVSSAIATAISTSWMGREGEEEKEGSSMEEEREVEGAPFTPVLAPLGNSLSSPHTPRREETAAAAISDERGEKKEKEKEKEGEREQGTLDSSEEGRISSSAPHLGAAVTTREEEGEGDEATITAQVDEEKRKRSTTGTPKVAPRKEKASNEKKKRRNKAVADHDDVAHDETANEGGNLSNANLAAIINKGPRKRSRSSNGKGRGSNRPDGAKGRGKGKVGPAQLGACKIHENSDACAAAIAAAAAGSETGADEAGRSLSECCVRISLECDSRACKCKGRRKCLICRGCAGGHCVCESCPCETCASREHHRLAKEKTQRETEERELELALEQERIFQEARERQVMRDAGIELPPPASPVGTTIEELVAMQTRGGGWEEKEGEEEDVSNTSRHPHQQEEGQHQQHQQEEKVMEPPLFVLSPAPSLVSSRG